MPLTECPACRGQVSTAAVSCPHCGHPIDRAAAFAWKRAWGFEWRTKAEWRGWPLVCVAIGRDPETLKLRVAKGIVAIGQFGVGAFTVAQFGFGAVFGFGQFVAAPVCIAQAAIGLLFGLGQFATGYVAVGQFAFGSYVLAQIGFGGHAWTTALKDPEAVEFFRGIGERLRGLPGGSLW